MKKINSLAYNTKTGDIYVYPIGNEYKRSILIKDNIGYFFKKNGVVERITDKEEIKRVKKFINNI